MQQQKINIVPSLITHEGEGITPELARILRFNVASERDAVGVVDWNMGNNFLGDDYAGDDYAGDDYAGDDYAGESTSSARSTPRCDEDRAAAALRLVVVVVRCRAAALLSLGAVSVRLWRSLRRGVSRRPRPVSCNPMKGSSVCPSLRACRTAFTAPARPCGASPGSRRSLGAVSVSWPS